MTNYPHIKPEERALNDRCIRIADKVVPAYRTTGKSYSCTGNIAKQWDAAYYAALEALTHDTLHGST